MMEPKLDLFAATGTSRAGTSMHSTKINSVDRYYLVEEYRRQAQLKEELEDSEINQTEDGALASHRMELKEGMVLPDGSVVTRDQAQLEMSDKERWAKICELATRQKRRNMTTYEGTRFPRIAGVFSGPEYNHYLEECLSDTKSMVVHTVLLPPGKKSASELNLRHAKVKKIRVFNPDNSSSAEAGSAPARVHDWPLTATKPEDVFECFIECDCMPRNGKDPFPNHFVVKDAQPMHKYFNELDLKNFQDGIVNDDVLKNLPSMNHTSEFYREALSHKEESAALFKERAEARAKLAEEQKIRQDQKDAAVASAKLRKLYLSDARVKDSFWDNFIF